MEENFMNIFLDGVSCKNRCRFLSKELHCDKCKNADTQKEETDERVLQNVYVHPKSSVKCRKCNIVYKLRKHGEINHCLKCNQLLKWR
jgi:hypothetical protein